jgi:hypothetical protein
MIGVALLPSRAFATLDGEWLSDVNLALTVATCLIIIGGFILTMQYEEMSSDKEALLPLLGVAMPPLNMLMLAVPIFLLSGVFGIKVSKVWLPYYFLSICVAVAVHVPLAGYAVISLIKGRKFKVHDALGRQNNRIIGTKEGAIFWGFILSGSVVLLVSMLLVSPQEFYYLVTYFLCGARWR